MTSRPTPRTLLDSDLLTPCLQRKIYLIGALYSLLYAMSWPLLVLYAERLSLSGTTVGVEFALTGFGQVLAGVVAGRACNRRGKRTVAVAGSLLLGFGWLVAAAGPSTAALSVAMFLTGAGSALYTGMSAFLGAHTPVELRTKVFAYQLAAMGVGFMVGPMLTACLQPAGLSIVCLVVAAGAACVAFFCETQLPKTELVAKEAETKVTYSSIVRSLRLMGLPSAALVLMQMSDISAGYFVPVHAQKAFFASPTIVATLFSCIGLSKIVVPAVLGLLQKFCSEKRVALFAFVLVSSSITLCGFATSVNALFLFFLVWCFAFDVTNPYIKALSSRRANSSEQASLASGQMFGLGMMNTLMPLVAGWSYAAHGAKPLFAVTGLVCIAGVGMLWYAFRAENSKLLVAY